MSDTPRTDAVISANEFYEQPSGQHCLVAEGVITFARQLERELNEQKAKVRNLTEWLEDIYELGADSMSVGLAANALNGEQHDETKPTET